MQWKNIVSQQQNEDDVKKNLKSNKYKGFKGLGSFSHFIGRSECHIFKENTFFEYMTFA